MNKIIINTKEADNIDIERKSFKYFFNKPLVIKDKKTLSLSSITAELRPQPPPVYDNGLIVISSLSIDESTIPSTIYSTSWYYARFFLVDLDDTNVANVYNSSGGASNGSGAKIRLVTFQDYGTGGFPRTTKIAYVENSGQNYEVGDYIIINENAFPTGYLASGQSVSMRININSVKTSRITSLYPTGVIETLTLNSSYTGEISTLNQNFTHSPVSNGQGTEFVWGTTTNSIILININNGGYGWEVGDIIWIPKYDTMADTSPSTFLVPLKVQVTTIKNITTPPLTDNNLFYTLKLNNLLFNTNNIYSSQNDGEILIINHNIATKDNQFIKDYKICELQQQILQSLELKIYSPDRLNGLSSITDYIIHLKIS